MAQVVVVGSYNQDHAWRVDRFPQAGETRRGGNFTTGPGGKGFNQAVACARQGARTAFIAACGDDALGAGARALAAREGIEGRWQVTAAHATGTAMILIDAAAQNQIVVALGANEQLDPAFVRAQVAMFADAKVVLAQGENNLDAVAAALELGELHRLTRILNPAPVHPRLDAVLLRHVDILTPNETEFALLLEHIAHERVDPGRLAERTDTDLHALARKLGVATVVVTLGARGAFVSHGVNRRGDDADFYRVAPERAQPVDTTGAGDCFSGSLAAALVFFHNAPFLRAVAHANRAAALSTETAGAAAAMPTFEAVRRRFGV
ncbi:MAG: ribokinase [Proteobacteria bacterium]|nr:ribokinase [Pseudomonadota bacterium]